MGDHDDDYDDEFDEGDNFEQNNMQKPITPHDFANPDNLHEDMVIP